jgi:CheY-like chemotaxis protein
MQGFSMTTDQQIKDCPAGAGQKILVVEDDDDLRYLAGHIINSLNYEVIIAKDGPTALEILAALDADGVTVDLVFSDVVMPAGMNGIDLSIAIWGRYPDTPLILTSGYPDDVLRDAGMSDEDLRQITVVRKPYSRLQLATMIDEVLKTRAARKQLL